MRFAVQIRREIRMCNDDPSSSSFKKTNYRVRFRHNVCPTSGPQVTRADIKKYDYFFETGQEWVDTRGDVDFVDESSQVAEDVGSESGSAVGEGSSNLNQRLRRSARLESMQECVNTSSNRGSPNPIVPRIVMPSVEQAFPSPGAALEPTQRRFDDAAQSHAGSRSSSILQNEPDFSGQHSPATSEVRTVPLEDPVEAQLYRFFVEKVGGWWDITSSKNVWRNIVPKMALRNPILLNAIFLMAAQHIRGLDSSFPAEPFQYHEKLLNLLIPHLSDRGGINDDATLAAAILLRAFEDFVAGTEGQTHLSTFELFTTAGGSSLNTQSAIVKACFLAHIRFEVYGALLNRQTPQVNYRHFTLPELLHPADDVAWANRMAWITARVLQWCRADEHSEDEWHELTALVDDWELSKPDSFSPFYYQEEQVSEGRYYPEIWFSSPHHTDSNQHLHIARTALAAHDPKLRYMDHDARVAHLKDSNVILKGLKAAIAIAKCNTHTLPALFLAGNFVDGYASIVENDLDRDKMLELLREVCGMGWSTCSTQRRLKNEWGWERRE